MKIEITDIHSVDKFPLREDLPEHFFIMSFDAIKEGDYIRRGKVNRVYQYLPVEKEAQRDFTYGYPLISRVFKLGRYDRKVVASTYEIPGIIHLTNQKEKAFL